MSFFDYTNYHFRILCAVAALALCSSQLLAAKYYIRYDEGQPIIQSTEEGQSPVIIEETTPLDEKKAPPEEQIEGPAIPKSTIPDQRLPPSKLSPSRLPSKPLERQGLQRQSLQETKLERKGLESKSLERSSLPRNPLPRNELKENKLKRNPLR